MAKVLEKFMNKRAVGKNEECTHTSMAGGKWYIFNKDEEEFLEKYCKALKEQVYYFVEKNRTLCGYIKIDFDCHFSKKPNERPLNKDLIKKIVKMFTDILVRMFGKKIDLTCFVLQRLKVYLKKKSKGDVWADGIHIQFPYIYCNYECHYAVRNIFIRECSNIIKELGCVNTIEQIYDKGIIESISWCMYGSTKKGLENNIYKIIKIYNSDKTIDDYSTLRLIKLLSVRRVGEILDPVNQELIDRNFNSDKEILKTKKRIKDTKEYVKAESIKPIELVRNKIYNENKIEELLNMLSDERCDSYQGWRNVGMILYACSLQDVNYKKKNAIDFFELWRDWSEESDNYDEGCCEKMWKSFKNIKSFYIGYGSLCYYAKEDNKDEYMSSKIKDYMKKEIKQIKLDTVKINEIENKSNRYIITLKTDKECLFDKDDHNGNYMYIEITVHGWIVKCTKCHFEQYPEKSPIPINKLALCKIFELIPESDIEKEVKNDHKYKEEYKILNDHKLNTLVYKCLDATGQKFIELYYYLHKDRYVYTKEGWYIFNGHFWKKCAEEKISILINEFSNLFSTFYDYYENIKKNDDNKKHIEKMLNAITIARLKIEDTKTKESMIKGLRTKFYDEEFYEKLDSNPYLIGFLNGTFNLEKREFRSGRPEDFISMNTNIEYISEHTKHYKDLLKFLQDIVDHKYNLDYLLKYVATGLTSKISHALFLFLFGNSRNGKSLFASLVEKTFGDYCAILKYTLLTRPEASSEAPNTELIGLVKKRIAITSEPENKAKINSGLYKKLTGDDTITARNPHSTKVVRFKQTATMLSLNNTPPKFDNDDLAIRARSRYLLFPNRFVDEPKKKNEKKINYNLNTELKNWTQDFMLLLIEKYYQYIDEGLKDTKDITSYAQDNIKKGNPYYEFYSEKLEKSKYNMKTDVMYNIFLKWYTDNYPSNKKPSKSDMISELKDFVDYGDKLYMKKGNPTTGFKNIQFKVKKDIDNSSSSDSD